MPNILIGPFKEKSNYIDLLSEKEILGDYNIASNIVTFPPVNIEDNNRSYSFDSIIKNLPINFKPEYLIFWGIEKEIIPTGIEILDFPIIGVILDSKNKFESILKNINRFDWILCDEQTKELLNRYGFYNVTGLLLKGFSSYLHTKKTIEKIYDIAIVDNDSKLKHDFLYRLFQIKPSYNVKNLKNLYGNDYVDTINSSKIVLNFCDNTLNKECFETLACNSLLFVNENEELKKYFTDKEDLVFYNDNNFESLLEFYLKNEPEREKITASGNKKVQSYSYEKIFENIISIIKDLNPNEIRKNRTFAQQNTIEKGKAIFSQLINSINLDKFFLAEKELTNILAEYPNEPEILNNLGVLYASGYFSILEEKNLNVLSLSKDYLEKALLIDNRYAIARLNLGIINFLENDYFEAKNIFDLLLSTLSTDPFKGFKNKGLIYNLPNLNVDSEFKLKLAENYQENYNDTESFIFLYCDLVIQKTFELLGDMNAKEGKFEEAQDFYESACSLMEDFLVLKLKLARNMINLKEYEKVETLYNDLIAKNPLYFDLWTEKISFLSTINRPLDHIAERRKAWNLFNFYYKGFDFLEKI